MTATTTSSKTFERIHVLIDAMAAAETGCPACASSHDHEQFPATEDCNGTGRVARVPAARRKCLHTQKWACEQVNCPGWLPNYDVRIEALLAGLPRCDIARVFVLVMGRLSDIEEEDYDRLPGPPEDEIRLAELEAITSVLNL